MSERVEPENYEVIEADWTSFFRLAISFVKGMKCPQGEEGKPTIIIEMLEYGQRLHEQQEER